MKYLDYLFAHLGQLSFTTGEIRGPVLVNELFGLAILIFLLATLYLWALLICLKPIYALIKKRSCKFSKLEKLVITLAMLGLIAAVYAQFIEPYTIEVTHLHLSTNKLPRDGRAIKLVQISDLHCDPLPRVEDKLPGVIAAQHPDFIVFTGDAINSPLALPIFKRCMSSISKIAPNLCRQR